MHQDPLVERIVNSEWRMFDQVQNIGQRASCQDDYHTFRIMRVSQLATWTPTVLTSYWADLQAAEASGVNLLERKYAYMMKYTDSAYYVTKLEPYLPKIPPEQTILVERIVAIYVKWHQQAQTCFPHFACHGRPSAENEADKSVTSIDAYLRGELLSYSIETCMRLLSMLTDALTAGRNLVEENYGFIAQQYGYSSLSEVEDILSHKESGSNA